MMLHRKAYFRRVLIIRFAVQFVFSFTPMDSSKFIIEKLSSQTFFSKNEIFYDLKRLNRQTDENSARARLALRQLCFNLLGVQYLTPLQLDLRRPVDFSDEVLKAAVLRLLNSCTICLHWNYNWVCQQLKFDLAKKNIDVSCIQHPAHVLEYGEVLSARRKSSYTRSETNWQYKFQSWCSFLIIEYCKPSANPCIIFK